MILDRSHKAPIALVIGLLLLSVCATSAISISREQRTTDEWVRQTLEVENRLSQVQVFLTRAEINRRGYLLTGNPGNVRTYNVVQAALRAELSGLASAVSGDPPQERRARNLQAAIYAKLEEMRLSIRYRQAGRQSDALAIFARSSTRQRTANILRLPDIMRDHEIALRTKRSARSERLQYDAQLTMAVSALVILLLAAVIGLEQRRRLIALAEVNARLQREIFERRLLETELQASRVRAEAAAEAKSSFLANMSHEIRTPMNGVIGFTELLLASSLNDEQRIQAELIADSGRAMMRLLNDILDLSKIEAKQMQASEERFDLQHALRACAQLVVPVTAQRRVILQCDFARELPRFVIGDSLRLRQTVLNLLVNAVKFTEKGSITVRARPTESESGAAILIEVEDTGIGIEPERLTSIFDQFVQANANIATRFGGTGLGLSISAQLAHLMGGSLGVTSTLGQGSCFSLTIPLRIADESVDAAPSPEPTPRPAESAGRIGMTTRILVAEDHDVNRMLIVAMLEQLGFHADLAADGAQAIEQVSRARDSGLDYGLVLMDVQMPGVDGCEATRQIRALGFAPQDLPILALTANAYADDIACCLDAGMQAHLSKPVRLADLDAALRRWTGRSQIGPAPTGAARFSHQIQERYGARRKEMLLMVAEFVRAGRFDDGAASRLADTLHKFAGSAELFGDGVLGEATRALEQGLSVWQRDERHERVPLAVEAIRNAA